MAQNETVEASQQQIAEIVQERIEQASAKRRQSLEEKEAEKAERLQELEEHLAANPAVERGRILFETNNTLTPEYRQFEKETAIKTAQQQKVIGEKNKKVHEAMAEMDESAKLHNSFCELEDAELRAKQEAQKAEKERLKAEKEAKNAEDKFKREEYERRVAQRRAGGSN